MRQIGGKVFLFWFSFISTLYRECDSFGVEGGGKYGESL